MPLAAERELHYGCSSEGEGWVLSRQEEKKMCLTALGLTNNDIDSPRDTFWAVMFRSDVITSEPKQTVFCLSRVQTPTASERCVRISRPPVTQHPPPCLVKRSFSIKSLAERQDFFCSLKGVT